MYFTNKDVGHMHRYIWEIFMETGVPDDCVIHHIDLDKGNNDIKNNLVCMTDTDHRIWHFSHRSKETLRKIGDGARGHIVTNETKRKISEAGMGNTNGKGHIVTEEMKIKMAIPQYKKVICVETGIIYKSITEAEKQTGVYNIGLVCNGKRKTAGGFHWEFI